LIAQSVGITGEIIAEVVFGNTRTAIGSGGAVGKGGGGATDAIGNGIPSPFVEMPVAS
jgi:hypothetical protein